MKYLPSRKTGRISGDVSLAEAVGVFEAIDPGVKRIDFIDREGGTRSFFRKRRGGWSPFADDHRDHIAPFADLLEDVLAELPPCPEIDEALRRARSNPIAAEAVGQLEVCFERTLKRFPGADR